MSKKDFKQINKNFNARYGYDLLFASRNTYKVGCVVEWDGFISKVIDVENYSFVADLKIDDKEKIIIKEKLANAPLKPFRLASFKIDKTIGIKGTIEVPNLGINLDGELDYHKIEQFSYEGIKSKVIEGDLRVRIREILNDSKEENKKYYRKKLKNLYIFDELLYAKKVKIFVENTNETEIKAALKKVKIQPKISLIKRNKYEIEISNKEGCPFAAKIEQLKDFID